MAVVADIPCRGQYVVCLFFLITISSNSAGFRGQAKDKGRRARRATPVTSTVCGLRRHRLCHVKLGAQLYITSQALYTPSLLSLVFSIYTPVVSLQL